MASITSPLIAQLRARRCNVSTVYGHDARRDVHRLSITPLGVDRDRLIANLPPGAAVTDNGCRVIVTGTAAQVASRLQYLLDVLDGVIGAEPQITLRNTGFVEDAHGVQYHPWTDGWAVGFRCVHVATGREEFVYLNPSSDSDDGQPNVFLYHGGSPDTEPLTHVDIHRESFDPIVEEAHPEHEECADGCGLRVDHQGGCRRPGEARDLCQH